MTKSYLKKFKALKDEGYLPSDLRISKTENYKIRIVIPNITYFEAKIFVGFPIKKLNTEEEVIDFLKQYESFLKHQPICLGNIFKKLYRENTELKELEVREITGFNYLENKLHLVRVSPHNAERFIPLTFLTDQKQGKDLIHLYSVYQEKRRSSN